MEDQNEAPPISKALLKYLEVIFPARPVTPSVALPDIYYAAGIQRVLAFLTAKHDEQQQADNVRILNP